MGGGLHLHSAGMSLGVQGVNLFLCDKIAPHAGRRGGRGFRPCHEEKADRKHEGALVWDPSFPTWMWKIRRLLRNKAETMSGRREGSPVEARHESTSSRLLRHKYSAPRYKCRGEVRA